MYKPVLRVGSVSSLLSKTVYRAAQKGTNLRGQTPICGFLRVPAVFCGFLRKSAVSCPKKKLAPPPTPNSPHTHRPGLLPTPPCSWKSCGGCCPSQLQFVLPCTSNSYCSAFGSPEPCGREMLIRCGSHLYRGAPPTCVAILVRKHWCREGAVLLGSLAPTVYHSPHKHFLPDKHLLNYFLNTVPRFEPFRI